MPATAVPPCLKVNVVVVIVAGFIATVKVAVIAVLIAIPVALFRGAVKVTVGGVAVVLLLDDECPHPEIKKALRIKIDKR